MLSKNFTPDSNDNSYALTVSPGRISITGKNAGVMYGLFTLIQLLNEKDDSWTVPCCDISDEPRFTWRGMHLDVARHFFTKDVIKNYIDLIAFYKMNMFHWHLTDDQGWRIQIKSFPKLTTIGAWRKGSMVGAYREQKFDSLIYGGYYSQDDIREIVKYADSCHVTIVPEIEMPGHCLAALAAYPQWSCTGGPFEVGKAWGVFDDVFCTKKKTIQSLQKILAEVCTLFPGKYIHLGGDEVPKTRWKHCSSCQRQMKKLHLKNESELQSWFMKQMADYLKRKGKQVIGWDEILEGGLIPVVTVMSWRGTSGGIEAAKQHHPVVMTPGGYCYFDHYQGNQQFEPLAIGGYTPVEKVYSYEPVPSELNEEEKKFILGAQGNLWTEYISTPEHLEYMAEPRMAALAEVCWSQQHSDWNNFQSRLIHHFELLDKFRVNYSKSLFQVKLIAKSNEAHDGIKVHLATPFSKGKIHYTLAHQLDN